MRILVFAYDFAHWKSWQGLNIIAASRRSQLLVLAAPKVGGLPGRGNVVAKVRNIPTGHPADLCKHLGADYRVCAHGGPESLALIRRYRPDVGIILGSRILSREVVATAGCSIINIHPGVLPTNRGLDCVPWAVEKGWPQGVAAHVITNRVDQGPLLSISLLRSVELDETLLEMSARVDALQMLSLAEIMPQLASDGYVSEGVAATVSGEYHSTYSGSSARLLYSIQQYTKRYEEIIGEWQSAHALLVHALGSRARMV